MKELYDKLERVIVPMFYGRPQEYARVMRWAIALNGSFFNTQRMVAPSGARLEVCQNGCTMLAVFNVNKGNFG